MVCRRVVRALGRGDGDELISDIWRHFIIASLGGQGREIQRRLEAHTSCNNVCDCVPDSRPRAGPEQRKGPRNTLGFVVFQHLENRTAISVVSTIQL
jgi:hypothetical protein